MLKNAYLLAKIGADTAENEQHIAEILPIGRRAPPRVRPRAAASRPRERLSTREPARVASPVPSAQPG